MPPIRNPSKRVVANLRFLPRGYRDPLFPPAQFLGALQNCEKRLLASSCLSVRMQQLGSHWKDFHDIWYLCFFKKSAMKIQVPLKSKIKQAIQMKTNIHFYHISLSSS
jgi:hypothetical protein